MHVELSKFSCTLYLITCLICNFTVSSSGFRSWSDVFAVPLQSLSFSNVYCHVFWLPLGILVSQCFSLVKIYCWIATKMQIRFIAETLITRLFNVF